MSIKIGLIAEDDSDVEVLKYIIPKIKIFNFSCKPFAPGGCGKLRDKCTSYVSQLFQWGAKLVFIVHDLDRANATELRKTLSEKILASKTKGRACVIIPIEEIEAWLLADEEAINRSFSRPFITGIANPERMPSPKEYIEKKSRALNGKPRYVHTIHNAKIAEKLDLEKVYSKCPSFRPFHDVISSL